MDFGFGSYETFLLRLCLSFELRVPTSGALGAPLREWLSKLEAT